MSVFAEKTKVHRGATEDTEKSLPPGWRLVRLGDVCELVNGRAYGQSELLTAGTPVLRIQNLNGGANWYYSDLVLPEAKYCVNGDLLYAWSASFGPYRWNGPKAIFHYHIWRVAPSPEMTVDFAYYVLGWITESVKVAAHGVAMLHMTKEKMENWTILLPPLPEQTRIAGLLSEQMAQVERARKALHDQLHAAAALPAACLREVFTSPEAASWPTYLLGDLVRTPIHTGISKPAKPGSDKFCLTLSAVRGQTLLLDAKKPAAVTDAEAEGNWVRPGCFYVVRGNGNKSLVGRGAFASDPMPGPVLFPDLLFQIDLCDNVDPAFFFCLWSSGPVRKEIEERARTAAGIYKINTGNLKSLPLAIPPLANQRHITADLTPRLAESVRLIERVRAQLSALDHLPAALLRQAFTGEV